MRTQFIEILEGRRFFCASVAGAAASALETTASPQETVKPAIVGPSEVEGTYKGVVDGNDGVDYDIKLVVTSTSARLTVEGFGTYSSGLTSKQFILIRKGTFDVDFSGIDGSKGSVKFTGVVTDDGLRISGTYLNSAGRSGTFVLKK
jgi:hypothetical protein